jgi:hypothetical protein
MVVIAGRTAAARDGLAIGRTASSGAGGGGGNGPVVAAPLVRAQKLLGISTRLHLPLASQTGSAGREVLYSSTHIGFPAWAGVTDWRAACPHFYGNENPGGNPPEVDIENAASVYASLGISGVFTMGSFEGQEEGVMTPGTWGRWVKFGNPTYTPSGTGKIRTAHQVATGALRPVGYSRITPQSEAAEWSATLTLSKIQTGGTITHNSGIPYFYGPCLLIGKGNDGRMVPIILGNSIDFSNDENSSLADSRGNMGFWQRGFDDSADRRPYINFAIPGSRFGQQASLNAGAFKRRGEILNSIETGCPADVAVGGDENSALADSVAWRQVIDDFADFINDTFGMPFAHRTMLPKVSYVGNGRVTLAEMTAAVDDRVDTNTDLVANPAAYPTFQIGEEFHDAVSTGKFEVNSFTALVVGAYGGSGAITLNANPPLGTALVFNNATASVAIRIVTASTANGQNWNVTCSTAPPTQGDGATVLASHTDGDGTHPTTAGHRDLGAPVVVTGKANFV